MLLPDMTHEEIRKDLRRDLLEVMDRGEKLNKNIARKILTPNDKGEYVPVVRYLTTKNKIKWVVRYAMKPGKKDDVAISLGTFYHSRKGLRYVCIDPYDYKMEIYNSHFFRRYNERLELNLVDDIQSIYKVFVNRNLDCCMIVETKQLKNGIIEEVTQIPDGLKLGKKNKKTRTTVWNTFISNKEYKGNQGTYRGKIIGMLNLVDRMGIKHKLNEEDIEMYELFRKNVNEDSNKEASIITPTDAPVSISKKDQKRLAKQKEIADKVLLALTNKDGIHSQGRGIFSVK